MGSSATGRAVRTLLAAVGDLAVPVLCGGCARPGTPWCDGCASTIRDVPRALRPRVDPGVPAWAVGRYAGPLRGAVLELKEHGRRDLAPILGDGLAAALMTLAEWGDLPSCRHLALVPAPTRTASARRRGGDPVTAVTSAAATRLGSGAHVVPVLATAHLTRDSAGLGAGARSSNLAGAIRLTRRPQAVMRSPHTLTVLVDDVLTTGATSAASVRRLAQAGVRVRAVVVLAGA
ncbi:ComF family protein [Gordonia zhaorongruii]|uniref:ComF family protein n=1 Tax=Gordonia zhaorongruii TaxID=2597659 RepID=UPI00104B4C09|nr:ComF family protein [Gordonia zhaorongruii]